VWNYEEATLLNGFDNHDFPDKGISKLCLINELDDSLLLVASCNVHNSCHQVFQMFAS
jgi:regulator-associated protein of mTOR